MITQYITSKQKLLLAVASRTLKVLSLLIIFSVGINSNNLFAQGVPANPNDPDQAPAPTITSQPSSMTACAGSTASFSVTATAGSSISYQWQKGGVNIGGATSSTLTLNAVTSADAGSYTVVVSSGGVPVTSSTASLVVTTPALSYAETLSTCASSYVLDAGAGFASVTWSASAGGSTLPSNPGDPDGNNLTASQYLAASNGWYKVVAVPASGCTLVDSVYVIVNMGPTVITTQPTGSTIITSGSATLSVTATGMGTLTYQWFKNGVAITGATASSFTVSNATSADNGNYTVDVTGTCGTVTSDAAQLSVTVVNPPAITSQPSAATQCAGTNVSFSVTATVSAGSIAYQWKRNGVNIAGATNSTLSLTNILGSDAGNYTVDITGIGGTTTSNSVALTVNPTPSIVNNPINQFRNAGQGVLFKVVAGNGITAYRWMKNGVAMSNGGNASGVTSSELFLSGISSSDAADYSVALTFGNCGSTNSTEANLAVLTAQPTSTSRCAGQSNTFSVGVSTGSASVAYQWSRNGVAISGATSSTLELTNLTSANNGNYSVNMTVGGVTVNSTNASLNVNAATVITAQPLSATRFATQGYLFTANGTASGNVTFQWSKDGNAITGATSPSLNVSNINAASAGNYALSVTGACGTVTSNNAALTVISGVPTAQAVCAGNSASFSTTVNSPSTVSYQWRRNGNNIAGQTSASLSLSNTTAADNGIYSVAINVDGNTTNVGSASLLVNPITAFTSHPNSQTRPAGTGVTFSAAASGTGVVSYQWFKDGSPLFGETNFKLDLLNLTPSAAGSYNVVATTSCGSATSNTATLTVTVAAPSITVNPAATIRQCAGTSATLSVTASGFGTLNYQWRRNNVNISGATSSSLSLNNITSSDAGSYTVVVSNLGGSVTSTASVVSIRTATAITTHPVSLLRRAGQTALFSVNGTGADGGSFQWKRNGTAISGATSSVLSLSNVSAASAADYTVDVTFGCGTVTSNAASLAVLTANPSSVTKCAGEDASFSVTVATGSEAVNIQWLKNNVNISGQTSSTLSLTNVGVSDVANYSANVTFGSVSLLSNPATLLVNTSATISSQPVSAVRFNSQSVSFTANVSGNLNGLTYQWTKDGSPVSNSTSVFGATTTTLYLSTTTSASAGSYALNVTGNCGVVTSNAANLGIVSTFTLPNQSPCAGANVTYSVSATGSNLSYQWRRNGTDISGANSASYTMNSVNAANSGNYTVLVSNGSSSVTPGVGILSVRSLPVITSQPSNVNVAVGGNANFSIAATNASAFRWFRVNRTTLENPAAPVGGTVAGAFTNSLTMTSVKSAFNNYRYICRVTGACGNVVSDTVRLTVGGIAKNELATEIENFEMNLFPVPAQNVINLVTNGVEEGTYSIRILDQTGKLVMDRNTSGSAINAGLAIEISDMSTGAYFMELKNANGEVMSMSKFIKIGN